MNIFITTNLLSPFIIFKDDHDKGKIQNVPSKARKGGKQSLDIKKNRNAISNFNAPLTKKKHSITV